MFFGSLISMSYALNTLERYREAIEYCEKLEDEYNKLEDEYNKLEDDCDKEKRNELKRNISEIKERYMNHIYYNKGYSSFLSKKISICFKLFRERI